MSIVALKRNSRRFQVPISAKGFSLNGGIRNLRPIGDTNLIALPSVNCYANNPAIIKKSTKNTLGHLEEILNPICLNGNCSTGSQYNWVKNYSPLDHSQGVYIHDLVGQTATNPPGTAPLPLIKENSGIQDCPCGVRKQYRIGGKIVINNWPFYYAKNKGSGAVSQGTYIRSGVPPQNCLPTPCNAQHFPPTVNNNGCDAYYLTPAQAIAGGLLPPNWNGQA